MGNIVTERPYGPGGTETRRGTKHFSGGTKVYIVGTYAGMCEDITVVGLARKPRRYIRVTLRVTQVENLRVKPCYQPAVLRKMQPDDLPAGAAREEAEALRDSLLRWQEAMRKPKNRGPQP